MSEEEESAPSVWYNIKKYKFESVVLTVVNLIGILAVLFFQDPVRILAISYLIGIFGSITVVSATFFGLKDFQNLPKKVYTPFNLLIYLVIGGILAIILQSLQPLSYSPIQAFVVGATWPAVVQGMITPAKAREIAMQDVEKFINEMRLLGE